MALRLDIRPEEISSIIREQIKNYENKAAEAETGTVITAGDGIVRAFGLDNCMANELVRFEGGEFGMAMNLEEQTVAIVTLSDSEEIREGTKVTRTGSVVSVPVGEGMIGRIVNGRWSGSSSGSFAAKAQRLMDRTRIPGPLAGVCSTAHPEADSLGAQQLPHTRSSLALSSPAETCAAGWGLPLRAWAPAHSPSSGQAATEPRPAGGAERPHLEAE